MQISTRSKGLSILQIVFFTLLLTVLVLTTVRLMLTEIFVRLEYAQPGFPVDGYGFTKDDRLYWAPIALDFLLNDAGIEFLGDLEFNNGEPVYNQRELRHMSDVKDVTRGALIVWQVGGIGLVLISAVLWIRYGPASFGRILRSSARITIWVMLALVVGLLLSFSILFIGFHRVFFEGSTWIFNYSDTLIRLFPERFWQTAFAFIAVGAIFQAGLLWLLGRTLEQGKARKHPQTHGA